MIIDTLLIIDFSHPWVSTLCHLYSLEVRSEMVLSHRYPTIYSPGFFVLLVVVDKFDRTRIFSDTSHSILKCNQCLFFHSITDADPPKSLEIFKSFRTIEFLLNLFQSDHIMRT